MAIVLALATTVVAADAGKGDDEAPPTGNNVTLICQSTPYPDACEAALASGAAQSAGDPFVGSMQFTMSRAASARALARNLSAGSAPPSGLHDCAELLDMSVFRRRDALAGSAADAEGATTWLSAALTNQDTCNESLAAVPASAGRDALRREVGALAKFVSTALALHVGNVMGRSDIFSLSTAPAPTAFPAWVSEHDRRLLESPAADITPDAVVARDGSGTHRSIGEAIATVTGAAPSPMGAETLRGGRGIVREKAARRKVIYVKAGWYVERVSITYRQENVMLVCDGKGRTIVDSHNSVAGGYTTLTSATIGNTLCLSSILISDHARMHTRVVISQGLCPYNDL
jgi:pectinesterase inhibitor-like protein